MIYWWLAKPTASGWEAHCLDVGYRLEAADLPGLIEAIELDAWWPTLGLTPGDPLDWSEVWDVMYRGFRCRPVTLSSAVDVTVLVLPVENDPPRIGSCCFVLHGST